MQVRCDVLHLLL